MTSLYLAVACTGYAAFGNAVNGNQRMLSLLRSSPRQLQLERSEDSRIGKASLFTLRPCWLPCRLQAQL